MKRKSVLIIVASFVVAVVIIIGGSAFLIYRAFKPILSYRPPPTPPELIEPRILKGGDFLARTQFTEISKSKIAAIDPSYIGSIDDMRVGEFDPHPGPEIVLAGDQGSLILDRNGQKQASAQFEFEVKEVKVGPFSSPLPRMMLGDMRIIDIEPDGVCEYLARGSGDGAAMFDHKGKLLWASPPTEDYASRLSNVTAGDLNGDGVLEFVGASKGILAFDRNGKTLWHQPADYGPSHLEIVDVDGDGKNEIVSPGVTITISDATGKEKESVDVEGYVGSISLCQHPGRKAPELLDVYEGQIRLIDFSGKTVAKLEAPLTEFHDPHEEAGIGLTNTTVYRFKGVWVKLLTNQPEFLAVVTKFSALDRSVLYVYSSIGELVYLEVLPESSSSLAVLPGESPGAREELLVAGSATVWRFAVK